MTKPSRRLLLTQPMALMPTRIFTPQKTTDDIWRRFLRSEPFTKPGSRSSDCLGPRGAPARNEREARKDRRFQKTARLTARLRAGRPRSQQLTRAAAIT